MYSSPFFEISFDILMDFTQRVGNTDSNCSHQSFPMGLASKIFMLDSWTYIIFLSNLKTEMEPQRDISKMKLFVVNLSKIKDETSSWSNYLVLELARVGNTD